MLQDLEVDIVSGEDVAGATERFDWILEDQNFVNCEIYKCVSDYMNDNNLINYYQDMDPLFDSQSIGKADTCSIDVIYSINYFYVMQKGCVYDISVTN